MDPTFALLILTLFAAVSGYPTIDTDLQEIDENQNFEFVKQLEKFLGVEEIIGKESQDSVPPQFMLELYKTVTNANGVPKRENLYGSRIVRCFVEKGSSPSTAYFFNISGIEENETILQAELHLFRKKLPSKILHPTILKAPFIMIKVYQVIENKSLEKPEQHKLRSMRYVKAHNFGWQVFDVTQAVYSWMEGTPNLGFLVSTLTVFEEPIQMEYERFTGTYHDKQPILVFFNNDKKNDYVDTSSEYYPYDEENDNYISDEMLNDFVNHRLGQPERVLEATQGSVKFIRQKRPPRSADRSIRLPRKPNRIVSGKSSRVEDVLTSMDIYERAMLREKIESATRINKNQTIASKKREKRETKNCSKQPLVINFNKIGLVNIIAPTEHHAGQCKGSCDHYLDMDVHPTNHAIIRKIASTFMKDITPPCCVPSKLSGVSVLYYKNNNNVVLKVFDDIVVNECGCH